MLSCIMTVQTYIIITHVSAGHDKPTFPPYSTPIPKQHRLSGRFVDPQFDASWRDESVSTFSCIVLSGLATS
jgi:hypothetical protein